MYLKLAFRNAKRFAFDYLLYIFTMIILVSIMCISNCIATFGKVQAGFQTVSLPLLITLIMMILVDYINTFMFRQRAKELATYTLLGMEKKKMSLLFTTEICVIGGLCFLFGVLVGVSIYSLWFLPMAPVVDKQFIFLLKSVFETFLYFCVVEFISAIRMNQKINHLQITELMNEKRRNQKISGNGKNMWGIILCGSISVFLFLLTMMIFSSDDIAGNIVSVIALPMLLSIFSFYKWLFAFIISKRLSKADSLYHDVTVYHIAEMTSGTRTSVNVNSIFCICLLFSVSSFICGVLFLSRNIEIFASKDQRWMGFLQISLCIIFMVIYFSIISLLQIVELKRQTKNIRLLHYIGKSQVELKSFIKTQTLVKLFMPTFMCFFLLALGIPFINYKMNQILPTIMYNEILKATGLFIICFTGLYSCYFLIVYFISKHYMKASIKL